MKHGKSFYNKARPAHLQNWWEGLMLFRKEDTFAKTRPTERGKDWTERLKDLPWPLSKSLKYLIATWKILYGQVQIPNKHLTQTFISITNKNRTEQQYFL